MEETLMGDAVTFQIRIGICQEKTVKSWGYFLAQGKVPTILNHMHLLFLRRDKLVRILRVFVEAGHNRERREIYDL